MSGFNRQPQSGPFKLDTTKGRYVGAYCPSAGYVNLANKQALTKGTSATPAVSKLGRVLNQTSINGGLWGPVKNFESLNVRYLSLWHGVFNGAIVGGSPKLVGISNSTTSQSTDVTGIDRATNDTITVNCKLSSTFANRTFSVNSSSWYGKTITLIGFYEIATVTMWLYVCVDGVVTKYSSALSYPGDPAPVISGTEQFCVGTEVIENSTRSPNVFTALAACMYGPMSNGFMDSLVRNPWQIFVKPAPLLRSIAGPSGVTGSLSATEGSGDSASALVNVVIKGDLIATETGGVDTATASGKVAVSGNLSTTEYSGDITAALGSVVAAGNLSTTEGSGDTASAFGNIAIQGELSVIELAGDALHAYGGTQVPGISGNLIVIEGDGDAFSSIGNVPVYGTVSVLEMTDDNVTIFGKVPVFGALSALESGSDIATAFGAAIVQGSLALTEDVGDVFHASGGGLAANSVGQLNIKVASLANLSVIPVRLASISATIQKNTTLTARILPL